MAVDENLQERDEANEALQKTREEFYFEKIVHLSEVNMYGDVYFSRYFDWQGHAREEFVRQCLSIDFSSGIKFVTKNASIEYYKPATVFDEIAIKVSFTKIKRVSLEMKFSVFNKKNMVLLAEGKQVIVFLDAKGRILPIPKPIKDVIINYFEPEN